MPRVPRLRWPQFAIAFAAIGESFAELRYGAMPRRGRARGAGGDAFARDRSAARSGRAAHDDLTHFRHVQKMKTIVCVADDSAPCPARIADGFRAGGYAFVECRYGASLAMPGDVRLLLIGTPASVLSAEYLRDPRPTLMLAGSHSLELEALSLARFGDDACRLDESFDVIALRLKRVLDRDEVAGDDFNAALDRWRATLSGDVVAGVLAIDLDHFLPLNERIGFERGNEVLAEVMARLASHLGPHDMVLRRHGDDIYVLLARADKARLIADAAAAREQIGATPMRIDGEDITVTGSAGLAFFEPGSQLAVRRSWLAMFMAKDSGRDDVVLYDSLKDASQDALTGAHSRRYFDTRFARELRRATSGKASLTLALLDLDDFGLVNKRYGHTAGDEVLRVFARVVLQNVRPSDWLARYGGEEFCLRHGGDSR